jgi:hypothetical protein
MIAIQIFGYDKYSILKYGAILGKGAQHMSWGWSPSDLISFEHDLNRREQSAHLVHPCESDAILHYLTTNGIHVPFAPPITRWALLQPPYSFLMVCFSSIPLHFYITLLPFHLLLIHLTTSSCLFIFDSSWLILPMNLPLLYFYSWSVVETTTQRGANKAPDCIYNCCRSRVA